jgi:hypothetical protein
MAGTEPPQRKSEELGGRCSRVPNDEENVVGEIEGARLLHPGDGEDRDKSGRDF